ARLLARSAAILFLLAMATGAFAALALSGQVPADGHIVLGAHVSALTGTLLLLGVAYTLPMLSYGDTGRQRLAWAFIVANFANWAISTGKAFPAVHGVGFNGQAANDTVVVLLTVFVVIPSLAGAIAWILGFRNRGG